MTQADASARGILFFISGTNESRVELESRVDFFSCEISGVAGCSLIVPGQGLRVGGPCTPPFCRTRKEFCTVRNSAR